MQRKNEHDIELLEQPTQEEIKTSLAMLHRGLLFRLFGNCLPKRLIPQPEDFYTSEADPLPKSPLQKNKSFPRKREST